MEHSSPEKPAGLPENAYRELEPGETYVPMVPPQETVPEITLRSILFGLFMNVVFAMAATYLALKVGQGIETAIPISILSVGLSGFLLRMGYRRSSLLENINILAIGTTSGIVAGGSVFTMPAIYILKIHEKLGMSNFEVFLQIFLVPFLGSILGVLFLIPFRRYFVKEMHGKLPFPEGTATNEILVTGETGGSGAWVLIYSFIGAMAYNFLSGAMRLYTDVFTTGEVLVSNATQTLAIPSLEAVTHRVKAIFSLGTGAEFIGLGLVIGVRYASIIVAGSFMSWFVIIPLMGPLGLEQLQQLNPTIDGTGAEDIFRGIPRNIGIGGIFTAGLLSIFKMGKVIVTALKEALGGLFKSSADSAAYDRTDEDINYPQLVGIGIIVTIAIALFFRFSVLADMPGATKLTIISVALALLVAFLFTTVSAWAIAMISVTPISGMTVTTIIITAVVLLAVGLPQNETGMLATLLVGGVVCTSLSMAGTLVTEFKLGFWLGASPKKIQWSAIIAALLASILVSGTIMVLAYQPGYDPAVNPDALRAPQANVMASALQSFVGGGQVPWLLYGVGVAVVLLVELIGISGLAFALGMYLPMELNAPILLGAIVGALLQRGSGGEGLAKARKDKAILIASGLIAGGAIIGVLSNALVILDDKWQSVSIMDSINVSQWMLNAGMAPETVARLTNWLGLVFLLGLCAWVYWDSRRTRPPETAAGGETKEEG
ncbi:MAG: oligopeptide transporter, OPT family [bacterium]|nr:oligopeptide transporter, OPT family [bacterium]